MPYATQADIVTLYGDDALHVADRDGDGMADTGAVTRALEDASDEIDSHIAARYGVPLATVPRILRTWCVDIALYRLALSADVLSDEIRRRYDDAIAALMRVASGKQSLVFAADPETDPAPDTGPRPIVTGGPDRIFTRDAMRDL